VDKALEGKDYPGGRDLSIADAALYYVEYWGAKRVGMQLPKNCAAHFERMMARPAVAARSATGGCELGGLAARSALPFFAPEDERVIVNSSTVAEHDPWNSAQPFSSPNTRSHRRNWPCH